jgi:hypothetical protein
MLELIQFRLFTMFQMVACNPEFWMVQYAPVFISAIS